MIKIYNISVPKKYTKDGEEKSMWNNVGKLVVFKNEEGVVSYKLELSMFPETKFGVFEKKDFVEKPDKVATNNKVEEISPDEIPF